MYSSTRDSIRQDICCVQESRALYTHTQNPLQSADKEDRQMLTSYMEICQLLYWVDVSSI
jgi:hypothetical protein